MRSRRNLDLVVAVSTEEGAYSLDEEFGDIDDNHVGLNINGMKSVVSASAGYYDDKDGKFRKLSLISRQVMRLSIVYSQPDKQLSVTLFPANISALKPLLSLRKDLSPYLLEEEMYLGFTASTGSVGAIHYMMGWFVNGEIEFPRLEFGMLPILPPYPKKSSNRTKTILAVCLTVSVIAVFIPSWIGFVFYLRHKKAKEVLEECEIQYGPHRFVYKELFDATKGFKEKKLLGRGGFGQVYKGALPGSDAEIAVKRTSHDSREGMSEFLAEISTIGRLRHPNLVRLLGLLKTLLLLALLYLDQEWVQVIINRDIKPPNVLIDHESNARLGDFGLAKLYDQGFDPETSKVAGTEEQEVLVDWILDLWEKGDEIIVAVEENIRQEENRGQLELVLKLGVLCSHQAASIRPAMSTVMRILNGVSELPDNLLDVVRDENLRGWPEKPMELLFDVNSLGTSTYTDSLISHGR
ncbi:hypothetical protein HID58_060644 [Brassica napus]|uniref:Protein kinase domain-containing protein n=1 Tax=Brassica napus TaxID=3708 RepID=A0ABQ7ZWI2_BRANA|nr:hypothetical protein HID58_060644 [Brassica napus]